jgi:hypothetical protein
MPVPTFGVFRLSSRFEGTSHGSFVEKSIVA